MENVKHLLDTYGLVHHQLASYDDFVLHGIKRIIAEEARINIGNGAVLEITNPELSIPAHTPNECRLHDLTYEALVHVTLRVIHPTRVDATSRVLLLRLPVMIRSTLCNARLHQECLRDPGGYFIVRGKERVLVIQERNAYNTIVATPRSDGSVSAEMRSMSNETGHSALTTAVMSAAGDKFSISIPFSSSKLPIGVVFKALGVTDDTQIRQYCRPVGADALVDTKTFDGHLEALCRESAFCQTRDDAYAYIARHTLHTTEHPIDYVKQMVHSEMFPHLGPVVQTVQTAMLVSHFVRSLILTKMGVRYGAGSSKDHLANKRFECAGVLIHDLLRTSYKRFVRALGPMIAKHNTVSISNICSLWSKMCPITKDIRYSFLTGSWGMARNSYVKTGVSQVLTRLSYVSFIAHLRRINIFVGREVKNVDIRHIHQSSYGFIDTSETPEGAAVGVVKNLALFSYVSLDTPRTQIHNTIDRTGLVDPFGAFALGATVVAINNVPIGTVRKRNCEKLLCTLRDYRAAGAMERTVSIVYDAQMDCIYIWCDYGRLYRPLVHAQAGLTFMDVAEMDYMTVDGQTWSEVHPISVLGFTCSLMPFVDHIQAPRVSYYSNMVKQALGVYATNHDLRFDTSAHMLEYTQRPIVSTAVARMVGYDRMTCGVNCVVAVLTYTGYNQEDCVIVNKSAVDRGLFVSHAFRSITVDERKDANVTIQMVDERYRKLNYNYHKVDPATGIVRKGVAIEPNDVLVSRVMKKKTSRGFVIIDYSCVVQAREEGIVDKVHVMTQTDGSKVVKIRIRTPKVLEIGDKVANVAAQKATCGLMLAAHDMPFTASGIVPDIILNPHALPSRMTISMLLEMVLGKTCAVQGGDLVGDATPFTDSSTGIADRLCAALEAEGFDGNGLEDMYNGFTGERMQSRVFVGITYYHKLKHLVSEKVYARGYGGLQLVTGQPGLGRSRQGALRVGEMERDCIISQGCASLLVDRLYEASDKYCVDICPECHSLDICTCDLGRVRVRVPHAFKLLKQQLQALAIDVELVPPNV